MIKNSINAITKKKIVQNLFYSLSSHCKCLSANDETFECIMNPRGKCALVTEGSNGVGYVIAEELLKKYVAVYKLIYDITLQLYLLTSN